MDISLNSLENFETWFKDKLLEEKERRIEFIKNHWNSLYPDEKSEMICHINNDFLSKYQEFLLDKDFNDLFLNSKENLFLCYQKIKNWLERKDLNQRS
jgi:hypothetical protein